MSAASQVWNVLEIRAMILQFFFASCTSRMHNPKTCKKPNLKPRKGRKPKTRFDRANESHMAIFLAQQGVMLHAHPIFLAWSTFDFFPAECLNQCTAIHGKVCWCLSQLRLILLSFLKTIETFGVSIEHMDDLMTGLRRIKRVGAIPVMKLIEDNQKLFNLNRMNKLRALRKDCLKFVILEVKIVRKNEPQIASTFLRLNTDGIHTILSTKPKNSNAARAVVAAFVSELNRVDKVVPPRRTIFKEFPTIAIK